MEKQVKEYEFTVKFKDGTEQIKWMTMRKRSAMKNTKEFDSIDVVDCSGHSRVKR